MTCHEADNFCIRLHFYTVEHKLHKSGTDVLDSMTKYLVKQSMQDERDWVGTSAFISGKSNMHC